MKKFLKIAGVILLAIITLGAGAAAYVKFMLPNVGDAPYVTIERTPERVARGKYLAHHVAVCMDCHSTRNWRLYSGPMAAEGLGAGGEVFNQEMGFPGSFYAPNITPYGIGEWTDGEVLRAITTGVNKDGKALFPLMAYHRFGKMDKEDVYSIIAYIRTLNPVKKDIPQSEADFPVSLLINTMPVKSEYQRRPAETDIVEYGEYLANATGCIDCHSMTDKGAIVPGTEFGGGMEFGQPAGVVRSPNITPDKETGIGAWTKESFVARFKMYTHPDYRPTPLKPDDWNTPMPWTMYAGMKESDLHAIHAYLATIKPIKNRVKRFEKSK